MPTFRHSLAGHWSRVALLGAALATAWTRELPAQQASPASAPIRPLPFTRFVLDNGLTVVLSEAHASPIVAVDVYYRIGSRDDVPGRYGAAHFCEHIMGEGSPTLNRPQSDFYRTLGGTSPHGAETLEDITHYNVIVPSAQLEAVVRTEADRLRHALSRADDKTIANVRPVIAQERVSRVENAPFEGGAAREIVLRMLFPEGHPYYRAGMSPMPDLARLDPAALKAACGPFYVPNNAVLAVSGDFSTATARGWIEHYFGDIPRAPHPPRDTVPRVSLDTEQRVVIEDPRLSVPQIYFTWIGASYDNPDRTALVALASSLSLERVASDGHLASTGVEPPASLGRLSRLLIQDRALATSVLADNYDLQRAGVFEIAVHPKPGASLTTIENLVDSVLADMAIHPVTREELALYNSYNAVHLATMLQPQFARADTLAHDEVFAGDPASYARQATAARRLTPADVERVRRAYLGKGRIVLNLVPAGKLDLVSKPELPFVNATPPFGARPK